MHRPHDRVAPVHSSTRQVPRWQRALTARQVATPAESQPLMRSRQGLDGPAPARFAVVGSSCPGRPHGPLSPVRLRLLPRWRRARRVMHAIQGSGDQDVRRVQEGVCSRPDRLQIGVAPDGAVFGHHRAVATTHARTRCSLVRSGQPSERHLRHFARARRSEVLSR